MNITSAKYTKTGTIEAIIDGATLHIPDDMSNRHRASIQKWVDDEGGEIELYQEEVDLFEYNANKRWEKENGGMVLNGMLIHTDDRSKTMILGARVKADGDPMFTTKWKVGTNNFVTLDSLTIITISEAVLSFVDACFSKEQAVEQMILDGTVKNTLQIDEQWAYFA